MSTERIRVFVSYAHGAASAEEAARQQLRVLKLVHELRSNGVDATFDLDITGTPPSGWPAWMEAQVSEADFVLVVATETYLRRYDLKEEPGKGKGAIWEGAIIRQELYDAAQNNEKFGAVLFGVGDEQFIPQSLRAHTYYRFPEDFMKLLRWLTDQPSYIPRPLGTVPSLPPNP